MSKKNFSLIILGMIFLFGIMLVSAVEVSYCCEKTKTGAFCQNSPQQDCDTSGGYRSTPASCEATSYCVKGFCYDSQKGTCDENTPERVCNDKGGIWQMDNGKIPVQCTLGCCLIGDQAAYVTQTRCKKLSSYYGLENNFKSTVTNEASCIALAQPKTEGACVIETNMEKTCKRTTRDDCAKLGSGNSTNVVFHEGFLCSAEELGTNCGPTQETACVENKDEVYFKDSCGNIANIYDAGKINDKNYWRNIKGKADSCGSGNSNANSKSCGNCNYFLGSICKQYKSGQDSQPSIGGYICRDLSCDFNGKKYQHGESWCSENAEDVKTENVGAKYYRYLCFNGEVQTEPCADYRQQVCKQATVNGFSSAACVVNKWQDCYAQKEKKDCENSDRRECQWIKGVPAFTGQDRNVNGKDGVCVPKHAPGLKFWDPSAQSLCALGNAVCIVSYEQGAMGGKPTPTKNADCLEKSWADNMNKVCMAIGDCGGKVNYVGDKGYGKGYKVGEKKNTTNEDTSSNSAVNSAVANAQAGTQGTGSTGQPASGSSTGGTAGSTGTQPFPSSNSGVTAKIVGFMIKLFGGNNA